MNVHNRQTAIDTAISQLQNDCDNIEHMIIEFEDIPTDEEFFDSFSCDLNKIIQTILHWKIRDMENEQAISQYNQHLDFLKRMEFNIANVDAGIDVIRNKLIDAMSVLSDIQSFEFELDRNTKSTLENTGNRLISITRSLSIRYTKLRRNDAFLNESKNICYQLYDDTFRDFIQIGSI